MNNPLSDGNESVIDIFVLGRSETGTQQLTEQLEHQDYRVTLFPDGTDLIETLRSGKPNLIICDTTSYGQEAYDCCRQIKSDDNLWMIPVMILTRASSLGDLLYVLDCNADNFIAHPYDSPYLLSQIETLLLTPVERQTIDEIKTQFKIQHDEQIFVVTADRRKLLEFLMSAFEIAVKNSEDLSSANTEIQALSSRLTTLEDTGIENARLIGLLSTSVKKKEQDERTLKGELEETIQALDEKTAEAVQFLRELGDTKTLLTNAEEHIRILLEEKEKTTASYQSENSSLTEQVSRLSLEISEKTTKLESAQQALEEKTTLSARHDLAIKEAEVQIKQLKTSLQTLTVNNEQLASALSSEKNRARAAELETKSVQQAQTQSELELTKLVNEQKDAARQQNDVIVRLKTELETQSGRCTSAETQHETIRYELEQLKAAHDVAEKSQRQQFEDLQVLYDSAVATIFAHERELKQLKDELTLAHANGKKSAASAATVTAAFNETRVEVEEREWKIQSLEKQIADADILKETSDEKIRTLIASLESVQSALNTEKEQRAAVEKRLNAAICERDETLLSVRDAHENVKTDLNVHKNDLSRLNSDLEAAALLRSTLQGDITVASTRIKELEFELKSAVQVKDDTSQQARSLAEELGATKATLKEARLALASEKEQRDALKEQLNAAIRERDENLQSVRDAHNQTKTDLEVHSNDILRLNRDLEAATNLNSTLLADFNASSSRIIELEHELNSVVQGKEQTGQQARSLSDDLERTKAELETERRISRTAEVNLQKSSQLGSRLEGDIARLTAEREGLKSALEHESMLHSSAVENASAATHAKEHIENEFKTVKEEHERDDDLRTAKIQKLTGDLEELISRQRVLEQKVKTLESEKEAAETRAEALSDEIQQARTALADEWEDHMNDEEQLAASEQKTSHITQSLSGTGKATLERERKWAVVVKQTDLPAEIRPAQNAVVATTPPVTHAESGTPDQNPDELPPLRIEDLFEDDTPPASVDQMSAAEPHDENTDEEPAENPEPEDREEDTGDQIKTLDDFGPPPGYGIAFNRQQWFDLLKWSHHSGALSQEQRMQIVRMGRLIQKGRKLTQKQDEQVREMMVLVQTLGYRFH